ncbi:DUF1684 domain-containing protein [Hanstruepera marina]|uniref:DUF1684 domain-containing protein n=1 Tax=Hanstruepera marina TaxID=2873265 RepID=UPI001CA5F7E7|nr:DUF1684 domain-containing protein [Hanstruepera marina]
MKNILILFLAITALACAQDKQPILGETDWQKQINADFKDATKSPLKDKDRKDFIGLDFFKFDSVYVVYATLKRTPDEKPFKMKTTTERLANYVKYGTIVFELSGKEHELNIYQNLDLLKKPGYEDYLFLPFLDNTNGEGSYSGGRYVEARIPEGDIIQIDFNTAYNPYCAYNDKYSCPIVPRENTLYTRIEAGVKAFKKH